MDAKLIDWSKLPTSNDMELLGAYYSFQKITDYFARRGEIDHVHELKMYNGKEVKVTEEGFREWLKGIINIPWNVKNMTQNQINTANMITDYLAVPMKQADQPIVTGDTVSFSQMRAQAEKDKEQEAGGER